MSIIGIFVTAVALISSMIILPKMGWRYDQVVYKLEPIFLHAGDRVLLSGCMEVTNDSGFVVGWGIGIKETTSDVFVSPRQTRNILPKMHHDSLGVTGYFEALKSGVYTFALTSWCGSTLTDGSSLVIETANNTPESTYGQLIAQVIGVKRDDEGGSFRESLFKEARKRQGGIMISKLQDTPCTVFGTDLTHHVDAETKDICLTCDRGPCPYAGNPFAISAARRKGSCAFNPPASDIKKAVFEDPLKRSKRMAKGVK